MEICRLPEAKFGLGRTVCSKLSGVQSWVSHFTTLFPAGIVSPEGVHSVGALVLYGSTIYSVRCILFNCINPDRITPQQMFFSTIWDISLWSNQWWVSLFSHPLIFFPLFS